jgi:hypothetical protein
VFCKVSEVSEYQSIGISDTGVEVSEKVSVTEKSIGCPSLQKPTGNSNAKKISICNGTEKIISKNKQVKYILQPSIIGYIDNGREILKHNRCC